MTTTNSRTGRVASKTLKLLFAPQLFSGLSPIKHITSGFVQFIAQILAGSRLIPATHRAVSPRSPADARLGEVLALGFHNLRQPGRTADQVVLYMAILSLLALTALTVTLFIVQTLLGIANAQIVLAVTQTACTAAVTTSVFSTPCAGSDMAQQWIDMLLLGASNASSAQTMSAPMTAGLGALFGTYSTGMLVIAGFLVLYHLLSIVAETAHEGKFGGRGLNQVWAPIRLIMAIGLLVPLGGAANGMNSGQYMVIQVAKWGSSLATVAWFNFAATFTAMGNDKYVIVPPIPKVGGMLTEALKILVCEEAINEMMTWDTNPSKVSVAETSWTLTKDGKYMEKTWDGTLSATPPVVYKAFCGKIRMPSPAYTAAGTDANWLTAGSGTDSSAAYRGVIIGGHLGGLNTVMAGGTAPLRVLAKRIWEANRSVNQQPAIQPADVANFDAAVKQYREAVANAIVSGLASTNVGNMASMAVTRGWVSAGVWFNSIARVNGQIIDYANIIPSIESDVGLKSGSFDPDAFLDAQLAYLSVNKYITSYAYATPDSQEGTNADDAFAAADGGLTGFLDMLANKMTSLLGTGNTAAGSNTQEVSKAIGAITPPAWATEFRFNTANPLAELSALGQRILKIAIDASEWSSDRCARASSGADSEVAFAGETLDTRTTAQVRADHATRRMAACAGAASALVSAVSSALIMAGATLAFLLPIIPFIRFMFGIMTWLVALFETVVAIPLVALAHIKTDGEGFTGPMAKGAYMLLLQLFVRPVLMIFGMIAALLIFNVMVLALNEFYGQALRAGENGGSMSGIASIVYTVIYASLAYAFANAAFKLIDMLPNEALKWIGGQTVSSIDDGGRVAGAVGQTAGIGQQTIGSMATMRGRMIANSGQ